MANWYNDIEIKTKKNIKIKSIIEWLEEEYEIDDEAISVEEKNNNRIDQFWDEQYLKIDKNQIADELDM